MQELPDLSSLTSEAKDALIRLLWEQYQEVTQRLEALEQRPQKTSKNSSKPPSKGFKPNQEETRKGGERRAASVGRAGGGRQLHPHPDKTVIAQLACCPRCQSAIPVVTQRLHSRYDKKELPAIKPIVLCTGQKPHG